MKKYFTTNQIRKAMALVLAVVLLVAAVPFGARKAWAEPVSNEITVTVVSQLDSEKKIEGATVELTGDGITADSLIQKTKSDGTALFHVSGEVGTKVTVDVEAPGYIGNYYSEVLTISDQDSDPSEVTIALDTNPARAYYVQVLDEEENAQSGAEVTVEVDDRSYTAVTSDTGFAYFPEVNVLTEENTKDLSITVKHFGYTAEKVSKTVAGPVYGSGEKVSLKKAPLLLQVNDQNGALAGATISFNSGDGGPAIESVTTDEEGKASVPAFYLTALGYSYTPMVKVGTAEYTIVNPKPATISVTEGMAMEEMILTVAKKRPSYPKYTTTPQCKTYDPEDKTFQLAPSPLLPGDEITYSIICDGDSGFAEIDPETGVVSYVKAGQATVYATVTNEKEAYETYTDGYTLVIGKAEEKTKLVEKELAFGGTYVLSDLVGFLGSGEVTFKEGAGPGEDSAIRLVPGAEGEPLQIQAVNVIKSAETFTLVKAEDDCYKAAEVELKITVARQDGTGHLTIDGTEGELDDAKTGWYVSDVTLTPAEDYSIGESQELDGTFSSEPVVLKDEGVYSKIYFLKHKNGSVSAGIPVDVKIDKKAPTVEFRYAENPSEDSNELVNYYDGATNVVVHVEDTAAGSDIHHIEYILGNGTSVDLAPESIKTDAETGKQSADFTISVPDDFDGTLKVTAYDEAGNKSAPIESKCIVTDSEVPGISVYYDKAVADGAVIQEACTMTVTVEDKNFAEDHVSFMMTSTDAKGKEEAVAPKSWVYEEGTDKYTATISLKENYVYALAGIEVTDLCGNTGKLADADKITFTIDNSQPTARISINDITYDKLKDSFDWTVFTNQVLSVELTVEDNLSGIKEVKYLPQTGEAALDASALGTASGWTEVSLSDVTWTPETEKTSGTYSFEFQNTSNQQFRLYVMVTDEAGHTTFIASDGVVIDIAQPVIDADKFGPVVTVEPAPGIHNGDVTLKLTVEDPSVDSVCSGLISITYKVYNDDEKDADGNPKVTAEGTVKDFTVADYVFGLSASGELYQNDAAITVDEANNSNNLRVVVTAEDRAGNKGEASCSLSIDTTAPVIELSYDPVAAANEHGGKSFFNTNRTATITVTERNFDPSTMVLEVKKDGAAYTGAVLPADLSGWKKTAGEAANGDDTKYSAAVTFAEDGDYEIVSLSCTDLAGNASHGFAFTKDADGNEPDGAKKFTIDKTAPVLTIAYDNNNSTGDKNGNPYYFQEKRIVTLTLTERNFDPADASLVNIASAPEAAFSGWKLVEGSDSADANKRQYTATISFTADGDYTFKVPSYSDLAANKGPAAAYAAGTKAPGAFNIDTVDPVISVKYDNNNQTGTKDSIPVFQAGRTAAITITERNFDASLVALTARNTNTGKVYTVDRWTNPDGDKTRWTAELVFDEEGRYDFQISCKDLSGRMSDPEKSVFAGGTKGGNSFIVDLKNPGAPVIEYPTPANKYEKIDAENGAESGDEKAAEETPEMMYFYPEAVVLEIHTSDTLYGSGIDHLTVKLPGVKEEITIPASELVFAKPADVGGAKGVVTIYARIPGAKEPKGAAKEASLTVPIDPNCEDKVIVTAVDKAGRKSVLNDVTQKPEEDGPVSAYDDHITVVTDNTAPVMTVQFDNNSANNMDGFYWFKAGRTMTVTITEKYFEYNKNRVVLTVSKKDHKEDAWTSENWSGKLSFTKVEGKEDSYEAKVSFPDDSFYQITELYYADPATNWAGYKAAAASEAKVPAHNDIEYRDSLAGAEKEFAVDKTPAVINVSIDNNDVQNGMYFKAPRTYTITITERNFNQDPALKLLALNAQKKAFTETVFSGITVPTFSKNGDVYTAAMTFPGDAEYQFAVSYTDQAGNNTPTAVYAAGTQSQADFIVDRTAPAVKVTYDNNNARNEKVFKADRTMTLTVTDEYFDPARANLTFTVKATDQAGKAVGIEDMQAKLRDPASWTNSGAVHTATLLFTEEANYEISMGLTDLAGNANTAVDAAGQAAPFEFTIDKTIPTAAIQVGDFTASRNGTPWNDKVLDSFTFSLFSNKLLSVSISSGDELSGVEQVEYIVTDEKLTNDALRARTDWQKGAPESFSFPITKDAHFIVYVRLNDRAGNERLLSTDGVTVDTTATVVEKVAPVVTIDPVQPVNDIYNGNVMFDVYAEDPDVGGVYSGLRKVEYVIYNLSVSATEPSASGTLYSFDKEYAEKHEAMRVYNIGQAITAIAADNNANEVLVRVTATDMAGNSASKETTVKIDITKPTIDIRYDNNSARQSPYYKAPRTATITIHERNFDPARVSITAEAKDSGAKAVLSDWTRTGGTGNLDDTVWTAELFFVEDGDYSFTISMTDEAGNPSQDAVFTGSDPEQFVIDRTKAAVSVSYKDTQEDPVYKDGFYKAPRTATIKIDDVNFDPEDVKITLTGALDGKEITVPVLSSWTGNGTVYTATLDFSEDGDYAFTLNFEDKAGNVSEQYGEVSFTVDKTRPELEISGVEDASANKGQVIPVITYSDVNADADSFEFKLYDSAGNEVTSFVDENGNAASVDSMLSTKEIAHGIELTIANIPDAKDNDDIYTLKAVVLDNAGNETAKEIRFSVNRYGSNFEILDNLEAELNGKYVQKGRELRIRETNADELVGKKIIIYKNNETIELEEGKGYRVEEEGGDGKWLTYTYTIFAENFADDAVYRVVVHSEDAAGNIAENTQDSKGKPLSFVVDHTAPLVTVIDLESGKTYAEENKEVHFSAVDNLRLSEVVVTLDGEEKYRFTAEDIQKALEQNEDLSFIVPGDSTRAHAVQITAIDQAGNQFTEEVSDFFVTTNLFVRYFNNKGLFFGSLGGFTGLLALLIILLAARKKKQDKDGKAA